MEGICRVCMDTGAFTNIFDETQEWHTCIADMISDCTGYVVRRGDSLPQNICPPCLEDAVSASSLKKTCEQSHKLYFGRMEEDRDEDICDNHWEPSDSESEQSSNFESDVTIHQNDTDKADHLERRYKCPDCPKSFKQKYQHTRHIRTHTEERPYKCTHCSKSFKENDELIKHIRTHPWERPFKCTQCPKTFPHATSLRYHIRDHTGERPFQCAQCSKSFKLKSQLKIHNHTHTGDRPYQCSVCSKSFKYKWYINDHLRTHTEERPYKCTECSKSFKFKISIRNHTCKHS